MIPERRHLRKSPLENPEYAEQRSAASLAGGLSPRFSSISLRPSAAYPEQSCCRSLKSTSGQALLEYALLYIGVIVPLTFGLIFLCQMLWVWHSVVELTRDTARYAATHCYQDGSTNVTDYARAHVPRMIDMQQFIEGPATINVAYFSHDPSSGQLTPFAGACQVACSVDCMPDAVTVTVQNYTFTRFLDFLKLPGVPIPQFPTSLPMESGGCDPQTAICNP